MIVDGKKLAEEITNRCKSEVDILKSKGHKINFTAVIVGDNPASVLYVNKKQTACEKIGVNMATVRLADSVNQNELNLELAKLSVDANVHAILLQMPLPNGLNAREAILHISPEKDVDGLTSENFGFLAAEEPRLVPCTALGIIHILKTSGVNINGADVCVIGRSNIVGKPTSLLLTMKDATVTTCHSKTKNLKTFTRSADIVIVAAGCPNLLRADMVKEGVVVIDVGVNRLENGRICGDVDFENVSKKASIITPVPGGVGPLTIAFLLSNILSAYKNQI